MHFIKTVCFLGCASSLSMCATVAFAANTDAGTTITNNVTVNYNVGSTPQTAETDSDVFTVDRKINLVVSELGSATTAVAPGESAAVTTFVLSNTSNDTLDFALSASQLTGGTAAHGGSDNFDIGGLQIFVDSNGNGTYETLTDTATFVDELAKDSSVNVFVVGNIPISQFSGDVAVVALTATAREGGAAGPSIGEALSEDTGANTTGIDTVFADGSGNDDGARDAAFSARDDYTVSDLPADLSTTIAADNTTPLIGFDTVTFTITITNDGPANASGVTVDVPIPDGYGFVSDTSGGNWDDGTGIWSVGTLAIGETKSFTYSAIAGVGGNHDATAEINASDQTDPDSSTAIGFGSDDLGDSIPDDDEAMIPTAPVMGTGTVSSASCSNGISVLDWQSESWTQGALTGSFNVDGKPITLTISDPNNAMQGTPTTQTPVNFAFYQGGLASTENSLIIEVTDSNIAGNPLTFTIDVGPSGVGVDSPRFKLFDLDGRSNNTRFEAVTITGSFNGSSVSPQLQGGSSVSISGNQAVGSGDVSPVGASSGNGTLEVAFSSQVDQITFTWGHGAGTTSTSGAPGFSMHDLEFCSPSIGMSVAKSSQVYDPTSANLKAIPGNDIIYSISVENTGDVPFDSGSVVLIDDFPSEMEFYNGDIDDGGPETDPVAFSQSGASMTFSYSTDVGYSSSATTPTNFSACTYSPAAGYDPNVRFICINPKGIFSNGSPNPSIDIQFRARVK